MSDGRRDGESKVCAMLGGGKKGLVRSGKGVNRDP